MNKIIVIKNDLDGYDAYLESEPSIRGDGQTMDAAIGNLIRKNGEKFGIKVEHQYKKQ